MILFLDANVVIYAVEGNPVFGPKVALRLANAQAAGDSFMVSDLTRMEALVGPFKTNNSTVEASFRAFFTRAEVKVVGITADVCDRAARVRAAYKFKPMDALQSAAGVEHGANIFLSADARLRSFTGLTVEVLS